MSNITSIKQQAADNFAAQFPILVQRGIDEPTWNALCNTIYPGANPDSVVMAIDYCKARGLDILLKPVHLVPMQVTDARTKEKVWRDVPMPGIGMYRIQADRSGNYAGVDEPVFGPDVTEEFQDPYNQSAKIKVTYPQWCKYTVFKMVNGQRVAFHALERWKENYATQSSKTECPNAMWRKRPYAQLAKCTEAQALRKAWPEIGSEPTAEEMEGKEIIINEIPGNQLQQASPAKSRALDAIRGQSAEPVTLEHEQVVDPALAEHANAYADHCAAIEGACDTTEWQQAYTTAWTWANETGDQNIIAGIKQIAGERKKQLSTGHRAQQ
ncbi:phage recombination protein Bet [Aeromonas hydrophila]|uniref:phage recombination protein Bet n=1 Tax=Aeromonas hydrophila TaxID=644 RepID=UPI000FD16BE2|nr:phage recombination protein Bet [Aeromonas hydrophila]AZU47913.1 recombinase [Aeromonas hydrophila]QBX71466.1 phage recombination protein Bet [Aeromonas hydrophila]QBX72287.1 phage recombination protein Bet [Aeromonas hydrophila]QBX76166.1 phage recombination protein Bet [Aeromonas hydrophila]QBX76987.1 phage recombination protein Bet [Aeromonas hydrophila]